MMGVLLIMLWSMLALGAIRCADIALGWLIRRRLTHQLLHRCAGRIAITFDDGPGESLQTDLMELLARHGAKATFFVLGERVREHPRALASLRLAGHEIANHGDVHLSAWRAMPWTMINDIRAGERAIAAASQAKPCWRPPHGRLTLSIWLWCCLTRRDVALWTIDGCDSLANAPAERDIARLIHEMTRIDPAKGVPRGGCILLHSFDRAASVAGYAREQYVLAVTESLLIAARSRGIEIVTMGELLDHVIPDTATAGATVIQSAS